MPRIAIGGFQHETNTFAPVKATWDDFVAADAWPGLVRGEIVIPSVRGINIPIAGAAAALAEGGHKIAPLAWAAAQPSAHVTEDAFERMADLLCGLLEAEKGLDALYLDLHGAMVTEHHDDGEAALLRRVRETVGDLPIAVSLDLHANVSRELVELADILVAYRTYPHVDMAETGKRAIAALERLLQTQTKPEKAFRQLDFLIPLVWQSDIDEPSKTLYRRLGEIEEVSRATVLSFCPGFPFADVPDAGPSVFAYGDDAEIACNELCAAVEMSREAFDGTAFGPADGVAEAMRRAASAEKPVVMADSSDNPGAGATCGTAALLAELIRQRAEGAVLGLLYDPQAAAMAHTAGEGSETSLTLGAQSLASDDTPVAGRFRVEKLGDGRFEGTGPYYKGARMELGPMALLREAESGVLVALTSRKQQAADRAMFRHLGVDPAEQKIVAVKSSVHYRADFEPIADSLVIVDGPGAAPLDPAKLDFRKLRSGVRLGPSGPVFQG